MKRNSLGCASNGIRTRVKGFNRSISPEVSAVVTSQPQHSRQRLRVAKGGAWLSRFFLNRDLEILGHGKDLVTSLQA